LHRQVRNDRPELARRIRVVTEKLGERRHDVHLYRIAIRRNVRDYVERLPERNRCDHRGDRGNRLRLLHNLRAATQNTYTEKSGYDYELGFHGISVQRLEACSWSAWPADYPTTATKGLHGEAQDDRLCIFNCDPCLTSAYRGYFRSG
jgi:hypothetical protein